LSDAKSIQKNIRLLPSRTPDPIEQPKGGRTLFVDFHEVYFVMLAKIVILIVFMPIKLSGKINKHQPDPFGLASQPYG
jgi:hypothetical protein